MFNGWVCHAAYILAPFSWLWQLTNKTSPLAQKCRCRGSCTNMQLPTDRSVHLRSVFLHLYGQKVWENWPASPNYHCSSPHVGATVPFFVVLNSINFMVKLILSSIHQLYRVYNIKFWNSRLRNRARVWFPCAVHWSTDRSRSEDTFLFCTEDLRTYFYINVHNC